MKKPLGFIVAFFAIIGILGVGAALVHAYGTAATGYIINNGTTQEITLYTGACSRVTNSSGNHLFVPASTAAEWTAFSTYKPSGVTIAACSGCWAINNVCDAGCIYNAQSDSCTGGVYVVAGSVCSGSGAGVCYKSTGSQATYCYYTSAGQNDCVGCTDWGYGSAAGYVATACTWKP